MDAKLILELEEWFREYVHSFYTDDAVVQKNIILKEEHTFHVTRHCAELAMSLGLDENDQQLAVLIGLFHDIGRFKQYSLYRTFNDGKSVNHALLGLAEVATLGLLERLTPRERECFSFAIANHNALAIPTDADDWLWLHAAIIRDADKLDIYRILIPEREVLREERLSPLFLEDLRLGRQSDYRQMRTPDDHKLIRLNWIYDVNFSWTMRQIAKRGYVETLLACLPKVATLDAIGVRLLNYMDEKCRTADASLDGVEA